MVAPTFFEFADPLARPAFRARTVLDLSIYFRVSETGICSEPLPFVHNMGTQMKDLLWSGAPIPPLINERVERLLRDSNISGWTTYPITLKGRDGRYIDGYRGLAVIGRSGPIGFERNEANLIKRPSRAPSGFTYHWQGLRFDIASWDGSDIFGDGRTGYTVVTDRVVRTFKSARVTNCRFQKLDEIEMAAGQEELNRILGRI